MRDYIIEQLQGVISIPGKQKPWIANLDDEQLYTVYLMLRNGQSAKTIARHIHEVWHIKTDSSIHSLSQGVIKFKKRAADVLKMNLPDTNPAPNLDDLQDEPDSLEANYILIKKLRKRVQHYLNEEERTGVENRNLHQCIKALTDLEKTHLKQKEWVRRYGEQDPLELIEKRKKEKKLQEQWERFFGSMSKEKRGRLAKASELLMEKLEERSVAIYLGPDGKYRFEKPPE